MEPIVNNATIKAALLAHTEVKMIPAIIVANKQIQIVVKQLREKGILSELNRVDKVQQKDQAFKYILLKQHTVQEQLPQPYILDAFEVTLTHEQKTKQELFRYLVKEDTPYPNSFESVGDLAHFNLTPEQRNHKEVIGEITLLKSSLIRCVVNKTQKLHSEYRTPELEHMAGPVNYEVTLKQCGVPFQLDYQRVYWCSGLGEERRRLLDTFQPGQLLVDLFCGVGPLAIRAAKQKSMYVIANDLNPDGYHFLKINAALNHIEKRMILFNDCARKVMRSLYASKDNQDEHFRSPDHIYMNLPVNSIDFLDVFCNYGVDMATDKMPLIHLNCFIKARNEEESKATVIKRISEILPGFTGEEIVNFHHIKNVTVAIRMQCVSFRLKRVYPPELQAEAQQQPAEGEPMKKVKQV